MKSDRDSAVKQFSKSFISGLLVLLIFSGIAGCSSSPMKTIKKHIPFMTPDTDMVLTLEASPDINPDQVGIASPLNVKTYLLSERTTFDNLGFESALDEADTLLSDQLLSTKEYIFQPKESIKYSIKLSKDSKFIVIVAAYRDMDKSKWKLVVPVDSEDPEDKAVALKKNSVVIAKVTEEDEQEDDTIDEFQDKAADKMQESASGYVDNKLDSSF